MINHDEKQEKNVPSEKLPVWAIFLLVLAVVSVILVIVARQSETFSDFFNQYISAIVRVILAKITNWFPFSLAEVLLVLSPLFTVLIIVCAIRRKIRSIKGLICYTVSLMSAASLIFSLFVWSFGIGYHTSTIDRKLGIELAPVSVADLKETANWLSNKVTVLSYNVYYGTDGASIMPYSVGEMNDKLMTAYSSFSQKHGIVQRFNSNIKPVMGSVAMSHAHLTGVYTFFTGEANLNVDFPDYTFPFTAAHEFAHQRGIARENEANFVAFLVCIESDDPYLQYSGYLNLYEYVISALYSVDREAYQDCLRDLPSSIIGEMRAYSAFYDKYRDSKVGEVNNKVNNTFLQANGESEGTKSYGMVVDLAVAGYKAKKIK